MSSHIQYVLTLTVTFTDSKSVAKFLYLLGCFLSSLTVQLCNFTCFFIAIPGFRPPTGVNGTGGINKYLYLNIFCYINLMQVSVTPANGFGRCCDIEEIHCI
jgi:hypothetical protein